MQWNILPKMAALAQYEVLCFLENYRFSLPIQQHRNLTNGPKIISKLIIFEHCPFPVRSEMRISIFRLLHMLHAHEDKLHVLYLQIPMAMYF